MNPRVFFLLCVGACLSGCGSSEGGSTASDPSVGRYIKYATSICEKLDADERTLSELSLKAEAKTDLIGDATWRASVDEVAAHFHRTAEAAKTAKPPRDSAVLAQLLNETAAQFDAAGQSYQSGIKTLNITEMGESTRSLAAAQRMLSHTREVLADVSKRTATP